MDRVTVHFFGPKIRRVTPHINHHQMVMPRHTFKYIAWQLRRARREGVDLIEARRLLLEGMYIASLTHDTYFTVRDRRNGRQSSGEPKEQAAGRVERITRSAESHLELKNAYFKSPTA